MLKKHKTQQAFYSRPKKICRQESDTKLPCDKTRYSEGRWHFWAKYWIAKSKNEANYTETCRNKHTRHSTWHHGQAWLYHIGNWCDIYQQDSISYYHIMQYTLWYGQNNKRIEEQYAISLNWTGNKNLSEQRVQDTGHIERWAIQTHKTTNPRKRRINEYMCSQWTCTRNWKIH